MNIQNDEQLNKFFDSDLFSIIFLLSLLTPIVWLFIFNLGKYPDWTGVFNDFSSGYLARPLVYTFYLISSGYLVFISWKSGVVQNWIYLVIGSISILVPPLLILFPLLPPLDDELKASVSLTTFFGSGFGIIFIYSSFTKSNICDPSENAKPATDTPESNKKTPRFKKSASSKYLPYFPQYPQDLFVDGAVIEGAYLATISDVGKSILTAIEIWKAETEVEQWPSFADKEITAFRATYQRMDSLVEGQQSKANAADISKLARAYFVEIRSNNELYQRFLQGDLTLFNFTLDFANTIGCGGTLQTALEFHV